ncbi:hypothetical protein [Romboutsia sp.]|uniref:hypothetical protein n=1 Tax=Romboutsia sp. TaxID=1965302 RepID=UPI003F3D2386
MMVGRAELNKIVDVIEKKTEIDDNGFTIEEYVVVGRVKAKELAINYKDKEDRPIPINIHQRELLVVMPKKKIDYHNMIKYEDITYSIIAIKYMNDRRYVKLLLQE